MKKCFLAVAFILVIGLVCMVLPMELMKWQDEKRLDSIETEIAAEVKLDLQAQMTLAEKFELKNNNRASVVFLINGKNYDQGTITKKIEEELNKLGEAGIIDCDEINFKYSEMVLRMYVDPEDGAKSMLLWSVYMSMEDAELLVLVDDESGKIINIEQWYTTNSSGYDSSIEIKKAINRDEMMGMAQKWGEYLGLEFISDKSGSAEWVNEFMGVDLYESDDRYIAVYKSRNEYLVYIFNSSEEKEFFSVEFYNQV